MSDTRKIIDRLKQEVSDTEVDVAYRTKETDRLVRLLHQLGEVVEAFEGQQLAGMRVTLKRVAKDLKKEVVTAQSDQKQVDRKLQKLRGRLTEWERKAAGEK